MKRIRLLGLVMSSISMWQCLVAEAWIEPEFDLTRDAHQRTEAMRSDQMSFGSISPMVVAESTRVDWYTPRQV